MQVSADVSEDENTSARQHHGVCDLATDDPRMGSGARPPQVNRIEGPTGGSKQLRRLLPRPDFSLPRDESPLAAADRGATLTSTLGEKRKHMEFHPGHSQQSTEDIIVETLSNMNNTAKRFGREKNSGKGVLKIQCSVCFGPIAVKVSKALRQRNDDCVESEKMCQKCFRVRIPQFIGKEISNVVKQSVMQNLKFPWWTNESNQNNFKSEFEPFSSNWTPGDSFDVVYTYSYRGQNSYLEGKIKLFIYFLVGGRDNDLIQEIGATCCHSEYMVMKERLGQEPYVDVKTLLHPSGKILAKWSWKYVPRVVLDHMKMVSQMQSQAGSYTHLAVTFAEADPLNGGECFKEVFVTNQAKLVVYPYENFLDFDVQFGEQPVRMINVATHKDALVTKCAFESAMAKIVATDSGGTVGFIRIEYVTFEKSSSGTVQQIIKSLYLSCDINHLVSLCGLEKYTSFSNSDRMQFNMLSVSVAYASEFMDVYNCQSIDSGKNE